MDSNERPCSGGSSKEIYPYIKDEVVHWKKAKEEFCVKLNTH